MSKKAKVTAVKCDAEHNIFLSQSPLQILDAIREYVEKV